jgi:hypothetical protein
MSSKIFVQIGTVVSEAKGTDLDYLLAWQAEIAGQQAELDARLAARESALAKLAALGLTEEEIAAL